MKRGVATVIVVAALAGCARGESPPREAPADPGPAVESAAPDSTPAADSLRRADSIMVRDTAQVP